MSAKTKDSETSVSSSAANVALLLRTVRGEPETKKAASPADAVLALLRSGPKSFPTLMQEARLAFNELDETLSRLENRGLVKAEGEGEARRYRLTTAGEAIPAD